MKAKAIAAVLLLALAASAEARFAWSYPRKAVSPDESGHWVVINGNSRPYGAQPEHTIPTRFEPWSTVQASGVEKFNHL